MKPAFFDEILYIVVFLLIISAMIHFATFVLGRIRVLYLARVGSSCLELGFIVFLFTNITRYFTQIVIQQNAAIHIVVTYEMIRIFLIIAVVVNLVSVFQNTHRAFSHPTVLTA